MCIIADNGSCKIIDSLQTLISSLQDNALEYENQINILESHINDLNDEKTRIKFRYQDEISDLEYRRSDAESQLSNLQYEVKRLQNENQSLSNNVNSLKNNHYFGGY